MGLIGYVRGEDGSRKYRLYDEGKKSEVVLGHPARFSPEDKFSRERFELKKQCGLLPHSPRLPHKN